MISIIIPAYNIEGYLGRCLDSVIAQTYKDLEIIVVDDGSTDGTGRIADEYASKDPRVRVIHKDNEGVAEARNTGLENAAGDRIGFVDGDDKISPDMYETLNAAMDDNKTPVVICSYEQIGDGAVKPVFSGETFVLGREEALETYVCDNRSYHIYHAVWSKLFDKKIISGLNFGHGKESEDIMFTTRVLLRAERVTYVDRPLYDYTLSRGESIMNSNLERRRFEDEIPYLKEQIECFKEAGRDELSDKAFYHFCRHMLFYYIDFHKKFMPRAASNLQKLVKKDKPTIDRIYKEGYVTFGDKVRMRLFLYVPYFYFILVELYDALIIPVRIYKRSKSPK